MCNHSAILRITVTGKDKHFNQLLSFFLLLCRHTISASQKILFIASRLNIKCFFQISYSQQCSWKPLHSKNPVKYAIRIVYNKASSITEIEFREFSSMFHTWILFPALGFRPGHLLLQKILSDIWKNPVVHPQCLFRIIRRTGYWWMPSETWHKWE